MKFEVEIEEGDLLCINDRQWHVDEYDVGYGFEELTVKSRTGEIRIFDRDEIEELCKYSGEVRLIREGYLEVFET